MEYEIVVVVCGYAIIVVSLHHDLSVVMKRINLWAT
jgi:hypothetical protein